MIDSRQPHLRSLLAVDNFVEEYMILSNHTLCRPTDNIAFLNIMLRCHSLAHILIK